MRLRPHGFLGLQTHSAQSHDWIKDYWACQSTILFNRPAAQSERPLLSLSGAYSFCPRSIGQNPVMWSHPASREAGKRSPLVSPRQRDHFCAQPVLDRSGPRGPMIGLISHYNLILYTHTNTHRYTCSALATLSPFLLFKYA